MAVITVIPISRCMLAEFLVALREFFEIGLVLGIMLAYFEKTKNAKMRHAVIAGASSALLASLLAAVAFEFALGGFEKHEGLFEGITLIASSAMVTWLNLWVFSKKGAGMGIEKSLAGKKGQALGIALLSFVAVFREGVELTLFLTGIAISSGAINLGAAFAGALGAAALSYAVFRQAVKLNLKAFFAATSVLLALLAAGLASQGVHELQEAGVISSLNLHAYDITPALNPDGSYPLLHEKGAIGAALKSLVGYATAPSLEQLAAYFCYLALIYAAYRHIAGGERR